MEIVVGVFIYLLIGMVITVWAYHDNDEAKTNPPLLILSVLAWLWISIVAIIRVLRKLKESED